MQPRRAPAEHIQNVADRRSARRGHDSDSFRKSRERTFSGRIEKPFIVEFAFERFEFRLQNTEAARLNDLNAELILPTRFEDRHVSVNLDVGTIGERLPQRCHCVSKNYASDLGPRIFKGEVLMTARMQLVI